MEKIVIKEWEVVCPECKGIGRIKVEYEFKEWDMICPSCNGKRVFTWIESIKDEIKDYPMGYIHFSCIKKLSQGYWSFILGVR